MGHTKLIILNFLRAYQRKNNLSQANRGIEIGPTFTSVTVLRLSKVLFLLICSCQSGIRSKLLIPITTLRTWLATRRIGSIALRVNSNRLRPNCSASCLSCMSRGWKLTAAWLFYSKHRQHHPISMQSQQRPITAPCIVLWRPMGWFINWALPSPIKNRRK